MPGITSINITNFSDYKDYLSALEVQVRGLERGFRKKLAEAVGCQSAFISQVMNGPAHLSLEQGLRAARHFGLSELRQRYFLTLIELARAGTPDLREYFSLQLGALRAELLDLRHNVANPNELSDEGKAIYYSHWMYAAVHILTTIPRFQTRESISKALGLRDEDVRDVIQFLLESGLLQNKQGKLIPGETQLHLQRNSQFIRQHHSQWRLKSLERIQRPKAEDMRYSTVSTLSRRDILQLRTQMAEWVRTYTETVRDSKEEEMCAFSLDFYQLTDS